MARTDYIITDSTRCNWPGALPYRGPMRIEYTIPGPGDDELRVRGEGGNSGPGGTQTRRWNLEVKVGTRWVYDSHVFLPNDATTGDALKRFNLNPPLLFTGRDTRLVASGERLNLGHALNQVVHGP